MISGNSKRQERKQERKQDRKQERGQKTVQKIEQKISQRTAPKAIQKKAQRKKRSLKNPFYTLADRLVSLWGIEKVEGKSGDRSLLHEEITALSEGKRDAVRDYYIGKTAVMLMMLAGLVVLVLALLPFMFAGPRQVSEQGLERAGYGEGSREQDLHADVEGETFDVQVQINARMRTEEQVQALLEEARTELEEGLLADNASPDEVRSSLNLPSVLMDGEVEAEYLMVPYGLIGQDGTIMKEVSEGGELVTITATLTCQGRKLVYETAVRVLPQVLNDEEKLYRSLLERIKEAETEQAESEYFVLPAQANGKSIAWTYPRSNSLKSILFLMLLLIPLVFFGKDQDIHKKAAERKEQLELDYPELLWRMTVLLGAGMTIRGVFYKLAASYQDKEKNHGRRYAYEEICYTCREMQSGVPEAQAYERFGRRCGLQAYIKLGALLSQNMRKGSRGLAGLLQTEAAVSMDEQKSLTRKRGERAQTRLLFPMVMMLGVVMIILMVPAFMSMG